MFFRSFMGAVCTFLAVVSFNVSAATIVYEYEGPYGNVGRISGLNINGTLWDAVFNDGSFEDVQAVSSVSPIYSYDFAVDANNALTDFLDDDVFQLYAYEPYGCTDASGCTMITVYDYDSSMDEIDGIYSLIGWDPPYVFTPDQITYSSINNDENGTYVTWELTAVPVPATIWLFASGLIGLMGVARKRL